MLEQLTPLLQLVSKQVPYIEGEDEQASSTVKPIIDFLNGLDESSDISPTILQILLNCFTAEENLLEQTIEELRKYTFNTNARILNKIKSYALKQKKNGCS